MPLKQEIDNLRRPEVAHIPLKKIETADITWPLTKIGDNRITAALDNPDFICFLGQFVCLANLVRGFQPNSFSSLIDSIELIINDHTLPRDSINLLRSRYSQTISNPGMSNPMDNQVLIKALSRFGYLAETSLARYSTRNTSTEKYKILPRLITLELELLDLIQTGHFSTVVDILAVAAQQPDPLVYLADQHTWLEVTQISQNILKRQDLPLVV